MKRLLAVLLFLAGAAVGPAAVAAGGADGAAPGAGSEGGIAGDPRGAIRALGGTSHNDFEPGTNEVNVPKLGGSVGADTTGGTPNGTVGPR